MSFGVFFTFLESLALKKIYIFEKKLIEFSDNSFLNGLISQWYRRSVDVSKRLSRKVLGFSIHSRSVQINFQEDIIQTIRIIPILDV